MKILVTGAKGFLGKNLVAELKNQGYKDIFEFSREDDVTLLERYTKECNFVFHLAGVNRPKDENEFMEGNADFTSQMLNLLKEHGNKASVLITSSIQAENNNPYGKSKKLVKRRYLITLKKLVLQLMYIDFLTYLESGVNLITIRW